MLRSAPQRPRRSVDFVAVTGEEYYLLGSYYLINHPLWPLNRTAANLNLEGIGSEAWGPITGFYALGIQQSHIEAVIKKLASTLKAQLIPEGKPDEEVYQRSDQYEFARRGVPTVYVLGFGGPLETIGEHINKWLAAQSHVPSDVIGPEWYWEGAKTLTGFYLLTGWLIANADAMPTWNKNSAFNRPRGTKLPLTR